MYFPSLVSFEFQCWRFLKRTFFQKLIAVRFFRIWHTTFGWRRSNNSISLSSHFDKNLNLGVPNKNWRTKQVYDCGGEPIRQDDLPGYTEIPTVGLHGYSSTTCNDNISLSSSYVCSYKLCIKKIFHREFLWWKIPEMAELWRPSENFFV